MLRGGPQVSFLDNSRQQQQKQKKKLSFKEPEVEGPLRNHFFGGCKSKTLIKTKKTTNAKKLSASVEDLTLEDQALKIAQNVGDAFSDLSITDNEQVDFPELESLPTDIESQRETEIRDSSPTESASRQENTLHKTYKLSAKDQEYLDTLVPPLIDDEMRGPTIENNDLKSTKNCIPLESSLPEVRPSSSMQHQIQLLRYQLEQQNQQTQMALHQVQLLQDQMEAESLARRKAQEQNNQLMQQNKELLNHMEKLFQQIEELERQIMTLEQEKTGRRMISRPETQVTSLKQPTSYTIHRRPSYEPLISDKSSVQSRNLNVPFKRSTQISTKSPTSPSKTPTSTFKKIPSVSYKPLGDQSKSKDLGAKEKETLKIADMSPPVLSGTVNPFISNWTLKSQDSNPQINSDKTLESVVRSRTGSFTAFGKRPKESDTAKSTLFGGSGNNSLSPPNISAKKYSSSTSDLYNSSSVFQRKSSLTIEEPSTNIKASVSNSSLNTASKLPRYQPYMGWQRRTSLTNETEQVSAISKDSYKNPCKTSLFNR